MCIALLLNSSHFSLLLTTTHVQGIAITQLNSLLNNTVRIEGLLAGFPMFDWVGKRTSGMSAVGLLPDALQGIDIREMLAGATLMDEANRTTVLYSTTTRWCAQFLCNIY
ncbi:glucose-6-phosphate isomerase 1, chloroplastic-like isoform X1 [Solanum tuberosum]|uniref:glucose-6-phosphate isomerase 1, chloroplastic-like isoform X1 n=1 Tax=Solanum tuberosum TaxID=4113 RepID=UPI00073A514C|nr:PREDICTED: glucose-6-phosphate isomerase 1, chloroplastic-like isoform X1 [Solanum tuberosum]